MVVCKTYRLAKIGKAYKIEHKQVIRTRTVITREYYEARKDNWNESGIFYELDQAATEKYYKDCQKINTARKEAAALESNAARQLAMAVKGITTEAIHEAATEKKTAQAIIETPAQPTQHEEETVPDELPLKQQNPVMDWKKEKMLAWLDAHAYQGTFNRQTTNKSDLMSGPIAEVLSQTSKAE